MNEQVEATLPAQILTDLLLAIPGVRGLFPHSVVAAAIGSILNPAATRHPALVEVTDTPSGTAVSARLSVAANASSIDIARAVDDAVRAVFNNTPFSVAVQIAHID